MTILEQMLEGTGSVAILGHIRPDGDCLGSALGLYNYLRLNYPAVRAAVYLEEASCKFGYLQGFDEIRHQADEEVYGLSAWTAATLEGWEDLPASWNQPAKACAWTTM